MKFEIVELEEKLVEGLDKAIFSDIYSKETK